MFAGTNAKVFIQIYGDKGKTELIMLESRSNNFERNTTEIFKVSKLGSYSFSGSKKYLNSQIRVPKRNVHVQMLHFVLQIEVKDVGKVFKIRIGHDGSGMGSGWFLESVDVKHLIMASVPKEKKKEDKKKKKKKKTDEQDEDEEGGEEMQEVVLTYHFPCSRWLAGGEEDGELVVELLPEDSEELEGTK